MLWRDLDCAPHPGQKVGCRLSTVTVHARSRRSTPTTFKPAPGDHVIDVFIAPCCRIPSQGASRPASSGASHPASLAPRVNQTQERWDPTFSEHSYGFRPVRSAHQAVAQAQRYIAEGYNVVVDLDLEKFFDRVNHDSLMARVAARVSDKRVLKLIRAFLNAGVMEDGLVRPVDEGTPQGGPLSPILSNLVLDDLDKELARRGHRFCRYADDCNIYVRSHRAGERVMASVSRFLTNRLRLKVNEAKSAVARPEERKFLGFSISNDGSERRIAPKALDKFKGRIRDITRRTRGFSLQQLIKELKPYIVGWRGYFGFCQTPRSPHKPRSVDPSKIAFVSLAAMANQAKPLRGVTPSRRSKVCRSSRSWFTNRALAHVRTSGGPASPTQRLFRVARSSPNLAPAQA